MYPNIQTSIYVHKYYFYILEKTYQYDELGWAFSCCCHLSKSDHHQCQLWLHDADDWSHFPMADRISFWWPLQVDEQSQTAQWFDLTKNLLIKKKSNFIDKGKKKSCQEITKVVDIENSWKIRIRSSTKSKTTNLKRL